MKLNRELHELNQAERHLANDLSTASVTTLGANFEQLDQLLIRWEVAVETIIKNREDLLKSLNRTVIEPLKEFRIAFAEMKSAIKRYEQLCTDVNRYTAKVAKYSQVERTSTNIMKLNEYESRLRESQQDRDGMKTRLEQELPTFLRKKLEYFQPSLAAFICAHILHSGNNLDAFKELTDHLATSAVDNQDKLDTLFASIDQLSIVTPS